MAFDTVSGDTSAPNQPTGTQRFLTRSLETFFARWYLFLVPVLAIGAFGFRTAFAEADVYRSVGTLSVSYQSFLGQSTQVRTPDFSYESPSSRTARQFNELMRTEIFARSVIEGAAKDLPAAKAISPLQVRSIVVAVSTGDSLMQIVGVADDPILANVMVRSAATAFSDWVIETEVSGSDATVAFYDKQLTTLADDVSASDLALSTFLKEHPAPADLSQPRPIADELEIQRLNDQLTRAQERYYAIIDKRDAADLATRQSSVDIKQRLRVVDAPSLPVGPESGLRKKAITIMIFAVLGGLVGICGVAIMTVLDRTVHSISELARLGAPARAVVPRAKKMSIKGPSRAIAPVQPLSVPLRSTG